MGIRLKYSFLIGLVGIFFLAELVVGIYADSITLQTDAFHMLSDLLALIIGLAALLALRRKQHHRYTYGWTRAEIIGGLINSVFLLSICFMLVIENVTKVVELIDSGGENEQLQNNIDLVLAVALAGLIVNFIGIGLFHNEHSHSHTHIHEESGEEVESVVRNYAQAAVLLHIIGDLLGSILVIVSGVIIRFVDHPWKFYFDPAGSMLIVIFISISSGKLLKRTVQILMHKWSGVAAGDIQQELEMLEGVSKVHEFHIWHQNNTVAVASMHIKMDPTVDSYAADSVLSMIKDILHRRGIHSSTVQPEWSEQCIEPRCQDDCEDKRCCVVGEEIV